MEMWVREADGWRDERLWLDSYSERFQNSLALLRAVKGGIFLRKMPLSNDGSGVQQFWNRCGVRRSTGLRSGFESAPALGPWPSAGSRSLVFQSVRSTSSTCSSLSTSWNFTSIISRLLVGTCLPT